MIAGVRTPALCGMIFPGHGIPGTWYPWGHTQGFFFDDCWWLTVFFPYSGAWLTRSYRRWRRAPLTSIAGMKCVVDEYFLARGCLFSGSSTLSIGSPCEDGS